MSLAERGRLDGRVIWVVGAGGGGIGTAVARFLAESGAEVVAIDRDEAALEGTLEPLADAPTRMHGRIVDARDREQVEGLLESERAAGRRPTGMVNVVGGLGRAQFGRVAETTDDTFHDVMDLNLRPAWLTSQVVARDMIAAGEGGSVVFLASIAALQAMPYGAAYAAAKAAMLSMARTQALEWGPHGIRVNAIASGTIHVPRSASVDPERDRRVIPLGRRGRPDDIAAAAAFLLSDLSEWVTGQVLAVDGGASIKPSYLGDDGLPVFVEDADLRARVRPLEDQ